MYFHIFLSTESTELNLNVLADHVIHHVAADWYIFALYLGIEPKVLDVVKIEYKDNKQACVVMLAMWLKCESGTGSMKRSWSTVVNAAIKSAELKEGQKLPSTLKT